MSEFRAQVDGGCLSVPAFLDLGSEDLAFARLPQPRPLNRRDADKHVRSPASGSIEPRPLAGLNHLTVPRPPPRAAAPPEPREADPSLRSWPPFAPAALREPRRSQSVGRTFVAESLPDRRSSSTPKDMRSPLLSDRMPARSRAEAWTNTSSLPRSGAIKPKLLLTLKNLTVPFAIAGPL